MMSQSFFFFQAEDGIRDYKVTGVQTCALPIWHRSLLPRLEDAAEWLRVSLPPSGRRDQPRHASLRRRAGGRGPERPTALSQRRQRPGPRRGLQARRLRHPRIARARGHRRAAAQGRAHLVCRLLLEKKKKTIVT